LRLLRQAAALLLLLLLPLAEQAKALRRAVKQGSLKVQFALSRCPVCCRFWDAAHCCPAVSAHGSGKFI